MFLDLAAQLGRFLSYSAGVGWGIPRCEHQDTILYRGTTAPFSNHFSWCRMAHVWKRHSIEHPRACNLRQGPREAFRRRPGGGRDRPGGCPRRDLRVPWPQRGGQDDRHPYADHPACAHGRRCPGCRLRRCSPAGGSAPAHRSGLAGSSPGQQADGPGAAAPPGQVVRTFPPAGAGAH